MGTEAVQPKAGCDEAYEEVLAGFPRECRVDGYGDFDGVGGKDVDGYVEAGEETGDACQEGEAVKGEGGVEVVPVDKDYEHAYIVSGTKQCVPRCQCVSTVEHEEDDEENGRAARVCQ